MNFKKILLAVSAAAVLSATGATLASADPFDHGYRHDVRHDHDRYWRDGYHGTVGRDTVFIGLRAHHYDRFAGDPFWFHGRYVVKSYRYGHVVYVEVNPYTGGFIGEVTF